MTWSATVYSKGRTDSGALSVAVLYTRDTDGASLVDVYTSPDTPAPDWLPSRVSRKILSLSGIDDFIANTADKSPIPPPTVAPAPPAPTQADLDRAAYGADVVLARRYQAAIALGLDQSAALAAVQVRLTKNYQDSYLDFFAR